MKRDAIDKQEMDVRAVEGFVAKLLAARSDLVRLRREYADTCDGEGVARYQLAIEAVDRAIIDEQQSEREANRTREVSPLPEIRISDELY